MIDKIKFVKEEFDNCKTEVKDKNKLEELRLKFLVKKGAVQQLLDELKNIPVEQKPTVGKELNLLRKYVEETFETLKNQFANNKNGSPKIDITLSGRTNYRGAFHPVRQIFGEMIDIFADIGFDIAEGPQIEDEFHNFDALNFQPDHPARDMQDTFFINRTGKKIN